MLSFSLTGAIGCVIPGAPDELTLAISTMLTHPDKPMRIAWVLCIARDEALRSKIMCDLREGDTVHIQGEIQQRRREIGELAFHDVAFIAQKIERCASDQERRT